MGKRRAVFLDLNGTLVSQVQVASLEEMTPVPGVGPALASLDMAGLLCPVVTVQGRIAKRYFTYDAFCDWFARFSDDLAVDGARLLGPYVCIHRAEDPCACAKPSTLLYEQAARDHNIDPTTSFVVGDTAGDVLAAAALGARGYLVQTGWGHHASNVREATRSGASIVATIAEAAQSIVASCVAG